MAHHCVEWKEGILIEEWSVIDVFVWVYDVLQDEVDARKLLDDKVKGTDLKSFTKDDFTKFGISNVHADQLYLDLSTRLKEEGEGIHASTRQVHSLVHSFTSH
eukprot:TRINITY_DN1456_c1_g1_i1.p1 TRINITY_DN1456_c1_g1~~TRINITY_DN1456_c1_g1_i1.p1  ORF type:complete len:103 (-),score=18.27 TRINITY_DN1456_c1_g1_i1:319-627(-)